MACKRPPQLHLALLKSGMCTGSIVPLTKGDSREAAGGRSHAMFTFMIVLLAGFTAFAAAQGPASGVEPLHFHHVHLNSVNPKAAAEYYPKPFSLSAGKTTYNGFEAVKTGNIYLLFTKVEAPPQNELTGPQTAIWHFGWNTPNSRQYNEKFHAMGLQIAQMWDAADGKLVDMSSDVLPGLPTQEQILELRKKGAQPTREGGFGYLRGPDGAMVENAQAGPWSVSITCTCFTNIRCARCSGTPFIWARDCLRIKALRRPATAIRRHTPRRRGRRLRKQVSCASRPAA